jgi:hypothetical protein
VAQCFGRLSRLILHADTVKVDTSISAVYGYTVLIGIGIGSYVTAGFSIVPFLVAPHDINNAIGFMAIGKTALGPLAQSSLRSV